MNGSLMAIMLLAERVGLRPLQSEDVWVLFKWFNDPKLLEVLGAQHLLFSVSLDEEKKIVHRDINAKDRKAFLIVKLEDSGPMGLVLLTDIDARTASAQLNIVIGEAEQWGKGYGREAVGTLLNYAFQQMNLHRVWLRVAEYNQRAIRCYAACGFQTEGRMREDHFHKGGYRDSFLMSILREERSC